MVNEENPLRANIEDGELVIRVGINLLDGHDYHNSIPALKFDDRIEWVNDVISELFREEEDGATPLGDLIDNAMEMALDDGSAGVAEDSPRFIGTCEVCKMEFMPLLHTTRGAVCEGCHLLP